MESLGMIQPREAPQPQLNSSFSPQLPTLQLAIDSTSLGAFKQCPRYYQLAIVDGWEPQHQSVHLTFGLWLHQAREQYEHKRSAGHNHQTALRHTLRLALEWTWDRQLARPWFSDHKLKNRLTLLRSIVWYLDEFGDQDPLQTVQLANGRPALELSFQFNSGIESVTGEQIVFCGHLDRIARLNDEPYIIDIKTTGSTISPSFFEQFTPGNQFSMYALAGTLVYSEPIRGLIVDGLQIAVGFTKCQRGLVPRTRAQLEIWLDEASWWIEQMQNCALREYWPQNDKSCHNYGGCQFRSVCSKAPSAQQLALRMGFKKRVWDPLQRRGDV